MFDTENTFDTSNLEKKYYEPTDTYEWYDYENDTFYNNSGDELINPSNYDNNTEGYTPFGDE